MSLLDQLKKQKSKLAHTETVVKTVDGKIVHENFVGNTFTNRLTTSSQPGYIVDNKPDLQIAKITDHLFMGSQDVACDRDLLAVNNVTHVISLGVDVNKFPGIGYTYVDVLDVPEFDIRSVFGEVFEVIDGVIRKKGVIDEVFEVKDGVIGKNGEVSEGKGEAFKGKDSIISEKGKCRRK
ncbi:dual specificity protein phosphatase 19 [Nilaparvata lugens]|uniref:dual specificity protein phosphatase 19 n=1 Tax=Nilaparvata lugens TaxID=108931 RepID=UPI00193CAA92|nr:dual specificity protein phosphatase 19 [Nilaparvata lugens]